MTPISIQVVFSGFFSSLAADGPFVANPIPAAPGFMTPTTGGSVIPFFLIKMEPSSATSTSVSDDISSTSLKTRSVGGPRCSVDQMLLDHNQQGVSFGQSPPLPPLPLLALQVDQSSDKTHLSYQDSVLQRKK
ncbi:hypothetical protein ACFX2K_036396 [Malus domestica]